MSSSSQLFELLAGGVVECGFDRGAWTSACARPLLLELADERSRRDPPRLRARGRSYRAIRGDDRHGLRGAVLGREPFDQVVGMLGEADLERADLRVRAGSIEDDHAAGALQGDVAGEAVDQLLPVAKAGSVEKVVPVEEEEHGLRMPVVDAERAYLDEIALRLSAIIGDALVGVYAGGSYALGGYEPARSDLDVAAVVRDPLGEAVAAEILGAVGHESLPCPARKLELVVYTAESARSPSVVPSFELNLNTGPGELRVDLAPQPGEGHWFAIDRSVLARHGLALLGPPAAEVFASPPKEALLPVLAQGLRWYAENAPESEDAVLNAGRALRFAREGAWVAKPELREWAASAPTDALEQAIAELERD
jgi:hypothetical protein